MRLLSFGLAAQKWNGQLGSFIGRMLAQWFLPDHWFGRIEILDIIFRGVVLLLLLSFVVMMLLQMYFSVSIHISIYPLVSKKKKEKLEISPHNINEAFFGFFLE